MADNDEATGAQQSLKEGATQLKESAAQLAEQQKKSGARQLSGIAGAVRAAADQLEQQLPGAASYIHDAAERIDHAASDLRNRNFSDIADSVRRVGQERPLALFGGAALAGFVLTRFLKSGQKRRRLEQFREDLTMAHGNIRPIPEIFTDLIGQVTNLVRKEGQLARAEISEKATRALAGMAMILLSAMLLIPALVILLQAAVMGLIGNGLDPTAAALIVGGAIFLIGMVLGLIGWSRVNAGSLVPDKTIDQLKRDAQVPRHTGITSHYGETGGARSERVAGEEAAYGDRNRAA